MRDNLMQDVRQAARSLARTPGFTAVAAVTLALGIGATTAIFTLLNDVVLEPLPYSEPERLVALRHPVPGLNTEWEWGLSSGGYFFFREASRTVEEIGVYRFGEVALAGRGPAEKVRAAVVSASLFDVLRARPLHGRLLLAGDNMERSPESPYGVAVLDHDFWRTRFGGDPAIVGTTIHVEGRPVEVVGVGERGLDLPGPGVQVWLPAYLSPAMYHANSHQYGAIARLADGASVEAAEAEFARLIQRLPEAVPTAYDVSFLESSRFSIAVRPLREQVVGDFARILWILLAAVGLVLLIAFANVANLFLVRLEGRRREVAIRRALGAGRAQLARRYISEGVLLALAAGAAAVVLAALAVRTLPGSAPTDIPRLEEVALGWKSAAFAALLSFLAGGLFGALPVLRRGMEDYAALRDGGRGLTASRGRHLVRSALVAGQVALALVLLASAGLMVQTYRNLSAVEPGLEPDGVLTVQVSLPGAAYGDYASVGAFFRQVASGIGGLPGVEEVGATNYLPFSGAYDNTCSLVFPEGWNAAVERYPCVPTPRITPGYFRSLGIPVRGEAPDWRAVEGGLAGVVVSRSFAERTWPGEDPIGKGITAYQSEQPYFRVVGVAGDVRAAGVDEPAVEAVYFPVVPAEGIRLWSPPTSMTLVVRAASAPEALTNAVRRIVAGIEPGAAIGQVLPMRDVVRSHPSMARASFAMLLLAIAAAVALILGAVGLYGTIAYVVGERTAEIGLRMALGARAGRVGGMVVGRSLALAAAGIAIGLAGAAGTTGVLRTLLFGVSPTDPAVLAAVVALLLGVALAASWLPARRATRVDPMIALRAQ